ncbi:MAG: hypothetical protein WKF58_09620 [Ilumatobacteraceae bacterium]
MSLKRSLRAGAAEATEQPNLLRRSRLAADDHRRDGNDEIYGDNRREEKPTATRQQGNANDEIYGDNRRQPSHDRSRNTE